MIQVILFDNLLDKVSLFQHDRICLFDRKLWRLMYHVILRIYSVI